MILLPQYLTNRSGLQPWIYRSQKLLGRRPLKLAQAAQRSWELAPGVKEPPYRVFIKDDHLERIRSGPLGESPGELIRTIRPAEHVGAPSTAYLLRDATLVGGQIYAGMYRQDLFARSRVPLHLGAAPILDSAVFTGLYTSARWYGHLLFDEFPLQLLAAGIGPAVTNRRRIYHDEPRWRELFGLPLPPAYDGFTARELIVIEDYAQNLSKRERYGIMRQRLRHFPAGHERIYLRRSSTGGETRRLIDEEKLLVRLQQEGFRIVEPAAIGVDGVIKECMHARVVVSVDGSHATPVYYTAADDARVMFLLPPQRVTPLMAYMCTMHGLRGGLFIGEPAPGDATAFRIDLEEFMQTLQAFLAAK